MSIKVKISYTETIEKIVDLTPEDVCYLHSGKTIHEYIPKHIHNWNYEFIDKENAEMEMFDFYQKRMAKVKERKK